MWTVGIKELKTKLSKYMNVVRNGNSILIKDHAEEVALITPLSTEYLTIRNMMRYGKAQWSFEKPKGLAARIKVVGEPISATVLEERK